MLQDRGMTGKIFLISFSSQIDLLVIFSYKLQICVVKYCKARHIYKLALLIDTFT